MSDLYILSFKASKTLYMIHGKILCRVIKCGLNILEVFENPYDLSQRLIIHTNFVGMIFITSCVALDRVICE
jgi:hypothetical protein